MAFSTIRARAIAVGLVPLAFLLGTIAVVVFERIQTDRIATHLRNSDVILVKAQDVTQATYVMQKAMRAYAEKPTKANEDAYRLGIAGARAAANQLALATRTNPVEEQRVTEMTALLNRAIAILSQYTSLTAAHKTAAANAILQSTEAKAIGDKWNAQMLGLMQGEQTAKFSEWDALRAQSQQLDYIALGFALVGFLATFLVMWRFGMQIAKRLEGLAQAAGTADDIPAHNGDDEITHVSRAYSRMTEAMLERESQLRKYKLLAEHTQDIILFVRRSDRRIIDANTAALDYGYTREELLALDARELRAPSEVSKIDQDLKDVDRGVTFETIHKRKDGTEFPVELTAESVIINGETIVAEIIRDISERRRALERVQEAFDHALEASTLKSQFVATMSHEIRTPMNAVIGMTELLLDSGLNEEQLHCATVIRDSGQILLNLINDILDFSRIEAKRVDLELVQFPIVQLVESIATLLSRQATEKNLSLMTYIDPAIPRMLVGDPGRLRQVLVNLVGNALKFTHHGSVIAFVDLLEKNDDVVRLRFSVEDTGIGIAAPAIERLFEPFRQADGSTTRQYGGSGLGLSISKGLVELMGGSIGVTSTMGKGSQFSFDLEFRYVASVEPAQPVPTGRALIIDDDQITRDVFHRYFRSWNIRSAVASGGSVALEMMRQGVLEGDPYTLALVDLSMPDMDGFQFGERVLADPDLRGTRLIMVTAYDRFGQGRRAIGAGFSAYLSKPLRQSELFDAIVDTQPRQELSGNGHAVETAPESAIGRVLVAEDNATNRHIALLQLQKLAISAEAVADGRQAVAAAMDGSFDVILMDCQMPNMDGFEATRHIRKAEARTGGHIRIIAMTANALAEDRLMCLAAGMDDYLSKPVTLEGLRRVLIGAKPATSGLEQSPLNFARLLDLFDNDRERTLQFLHSALPKLHAVIDRLEAATTPEIRQATAHELKGTAANIGADELASVAESGDISAIQGALARLTAASMDLAKPK